MTTKTPDEIAERAARAVCKAHGVKREDKSERWTAALGWAMGDSIPYEQAQRELVAAALEIDRAQRAADLETLADAASHWATELTDYVIDGSLAAGDIESAEAQGAERDAIQAALGRYIEQKESAA